MGRIGNHTTQQAPPPPPDPDPWNTTVGTEGADPDPASF